MENTNEILVISNELKKQVNYSITEEKLEQITIEALALKVESVDDLKGYGACKAKRNEIVKLRTGLDKERVKIKSEAQAFVQYVDSTARGIKNRLEDLESTLKAQELIVENEIARKKREFEEAQERKKIERVQTLRQFRFEVKFEDLEALTNMSDDDFRTLSDNAEVQFKQQLDREEQARKEREAEAIRIKELEAESKKKDAELKAMQDKIAEMDRIANEEARKRADEDRARAEAIAKVEREKAQEQERLRLEAEAKAKAEQDRLQAEIDAQEAEKQRLAEEQRQKQEAEEKAKAEREAELQRQANNKALLEEIKREYPTLEEAWLKIFNLLKRLKELQGVYDRKINTGVVFNHGGSIYRGVLVEDE